MATIKSHTDLPQSKKLANILPPESADMCYSNDGTAIKIDANPYTVRYSMWKDCVIETIPCWSLAALIDVLPNENMLVKTTDGEYYWLAKDVMTKHYNNPVDACYEMIIRLNELKML